MIYKGLYQNLKVLTQTFVVFTIIHIATTYHSTSPEKCKLFSNKMIFFTYEKAPFSHFMILTGI